MGTGVLVSMYVTETLLVGTPLQSVQPGSMSKALNLCGGFCLNLQTSSWLRMTEVGYGVRRILCPQWTVSSLAVLSPEAQCLSAVVISPLP